MSNLFNFLVVLYIFASVVVYKIDGQNWKSIVLMKFLVQW